MDDPRLCALMAFLGLTLATAQWIGLVVAGVALLLGLRAARQIQRIRTDLNAVMEQQARAATELKQTASLDPDDA